LVVPPSPANHRPLVAFELGQQPVVDRFESLLLSVLKSKALLTLDLQTGHLDRSLLLSAASEVRGNDSSEPDSSSAAGGDNGGDIHGNIMNACHA